MIQKAHEKIRKTQKVVCIKKVKMSLKVLFFTFTRSYMILNLITNFSCILVVMETFHPAEIITMIVDSKIKYHASIVTLAENSVHSSSIVPQLINWFVSVDQFSGMAHLSTVNKEGDQGLPPQYACLHEFFLSRLPRMES